MKIFKRFLIALVGYEVVFGSMFAAAGKTWLTVAMMILCIPAALVTAAGWDDTPEDEK